MKRLTFTISIKILLLFIIPNLNAQWTRPSGVNGYVNSFLQLDSVTVLAGTNTGNLYVSNDLGETWVSTSIYDTGSFIYCLTRNGDKIFAGTNRGILVSIDNGLSWNSFMTYDINRPVKCISFNEQYIYAGGAGEVLTSSDNGKSWKKITLNISDTISVTSINFFENSIYASTDLAGIYVTVNGGLHWDAINSGFGSRIINDMIITNNRLFAAARDGIYSYDKTRKYWNKIHDVWTGVNRLYEFDSLLYSCNNLFGLSYSTDSGNKWNEWNILYKGGCVHELSYAFAFIKIGSISLVGLGKGLYRTTDNGETWNAVGFTDAFAYDIEAFDSLLIAGTANYGILISSNRGSNWIQSTEGLTRSYVLTIAVQDSIIFAGTYLGGVFRSLNKGKSWHEINIGLNGVHIEKIIVKDRLLFAGTNDDGMYRSDDKGESWTSINKGLKGNAKFIKSIIRHNDWIIIGTSDGIYTSDNNGENWNKSTSMSESVVYDFVGLDNKIFAGIPSDGVYATSDNGKNLEKLNNGLMNIGVWCLYSDGKNLFAGTAGGVFVSSNNGENWQGINEGFPEVSIYSVYSDEQYLYVGTFGKGIWRRPLTEIISVE